MYTRDYVLGVSTRASRVEVMLTTTQANPEISLPHRPPVRLLLVPVNDSVECGHMKTMAG